MKTDSKSNLTLGIIVVILIVGGYFVWNQYKSPKVSPEAQVQAEQARQLLADVNKIILTPKGEDPIIATINDASGLIKTQPFYAGSRNGDIVLIYQKAAKVIVYSPERNMIINVGPIIPQQLAQPAVTSTSTKK